MPRALLVALLCLLAGGVGYGLGSMRASAPANLVDIAAEPDGDPIPGERSLELAEVHRVTLCLSASTEVQPQLIEADALIRQHLAAAGVSVVEPGQPADAEVTTHLDSHHFRAFDAHGVAVELHLVGKHHVRLGDDLRLIPHDIWQSDTTRLVQPEAIPREVIQALDELVQHLVAARARARAAKR